MSMDLASRVERLEKSARRWRMAACAMGACGLLAVCMSQATKDAHDLLSDVDPFQAGVGKTIVAERITLVDHEGKRVGVSMVGGAPGGPFISVGNGDSETQIRGERITVGSIIPMNVPGVKDKVYMLGAPQVSIDAQSVSISDSNDKLRAVLGVTQTENIQTGASTTSSPGTMTLFGKGGKVTHQIE